MGRMILEAKPDEAHEYVELQLEEDGRPLGHVIRFDGASAEKHAYAVAKARAMLNDPVIPMLEPNSRSRQWSVGPS